MDHLVGGHPNRGFGQVGKAAQFGGGALGAAAPSDEDADGLVDVGHVRETVQARAIA